MSSGPRARPMARPEARRSRARSEGQPMGQAHPVSLARVQSPDGKAQWLALGPARGSAQGPLGPKPKAQRLAQAHLVGARPSAYLLTAVHI